MSHETHPPEQSPTAREAFEFESRLAHDDQAQADWELYLQNRPYKDEQGRVHDPANGDAVQPLNPNDKNGAAYFDKQRQIAAGVDKKGFNEDQAYENMSIPELARKLAHAEYHNDQLAVDKTTAMNIYDVLTDKMEEEAYKLNKRPGFSRTMTRDSKHNAGTAETAEDEVLNRVTAIMDRETQLLRRKDPTLSGDQRKAKTPKQTQADGEAKDGDQPDVKSTKGDKETQDIDFRNMDVVDLMQAGYSVNMAHLIKEISNRPGYHVTNPDELRDYFNDQDRIKRDHPGFDKLPIFQKAFESKDVNKKKSKAKNKAEQDEAEPAIPKVARMRRIGGAALRGFRRAQPQPEVDRRPERNEQGIFIAGPAEVDSDAPTIPLKAGRAAKRTVQKKLADTRARQQAAKQNRLAYLNTASWGVNPNRLQPKESTKKSLNEREQDDNARRKTSRAKKLGNKAMAFGLNQGTKVAKRILDPREKGNKK